jgi:hypothetical protein
LHLFKKKKKPIMTLEAFRTVLSFETQDTFLSVCRIQVYVVQLKKYVWRFLEDNTPKLLLWEGNSCPSFDGTIQPQQLPAQQDGHVIPTGTAWQGESLIWLKSKPTLLFWSLLLRVRTHICEV